LKAIVYPSKIKGTISAPPSKSYTHRAIVCGLLSNGTSIVENPLYCDDTNATINLAEMMGAKIKREKNLRITPPSRLLAPPSEMNCYASGTTLRLFSGIAALVDGKCVLTGDSTLLRRPIGGLVNALQQLGIEARCLGTHGKPPVEILGDGHMDGNEAIIRGDISSQYITSLLLPCARADNSVTIRITSNLESQPYVDMTIQVMKDYGVTVKPSSNWREICIDGGQEYLPITYEVEGDYSSASFLFAAGAIAGSIDVTNLEKETLQGDAKILYYLEKMGIEISSFDDHFSLESNTLNAQTIDVSNTPDLVPVLAVLATQAKGVTKIINASRLRLKESDRLRTTTKELTKLGADIHERADGIEIRGPVSLQGGIVNPHNDHRIAMAGAIAGLTAKLPVVVENIECVNKSYPSFIQDLESVGAQIELLENEQENDVT
jgi:3-phosphoshikimate 1-carboxyvinyltransferase